MGLNRLNSNDVSIPSSVGVKTTGRVAPVKLVKSPVTKTAAEKEEVVKEASFANPGSLLDKSLSVALPAVIAGGIIGGTGHMADFIGGQIDKMKARRAFDAALKLNPKLNSHPRGVLESYFDLVLQSSPSVATNPLLLANYLDYMIGHEGALNFAAFKQLAELEGTMANTSKTKRPLGDMTNKAIIDASVRSFVPGGR